MTASWTELMTSAEEGTGQTGLCPYSDLGTNVSLTHRALLNDASLGLYRVYENVKVQAPEMLAAKASMDKEQLKMERAIATAEDLQKILANLHRCKSFNQVNQWLKEAIQDA
ncbi:hypothetical protein BJ684DRAFT_14522 [Piptocephalis cylindrospora]|uniref:Uncharacterized protein n=1 Tax=Piptocephalis cylindrospora TaxID=1907219 RepID=A0A4P9Y7W8_9FUNG|nr:hypothetical protein BJ684DRAFT_14522 [Piptocephalis cylindrospora]|eukprot:RKP15198.1 hypothetical protein BJ684DRAFT_14522 [Piptocephalis cylindrospora]